MSTDEQRNREIIRRVYEASFAGDANALPSIMDEDFEESRGWVFSQINDRLASVMPSARGLHSAGSAQVATPADPPEDHLNEHALVNLDEQFFDNPAAYVRVEKR